MIEITAYHGTSSANESSIINNGFFVSEGYENEQWLGDGVYFFCEGLFKEPDKYAEKWAIAEAWDNRIKNYKYKDYVILKAKVTVTEDCFWDLTTSEGLEIFDYLRSKYVESLKTAKLAFKETPKDGHLINSFVQNSSNCTIKVVRGNFYIKFSEERKVKANFRTPNCTIMSVIDTNCIGSVRTIKKNKISSFI